MKDYLTIETEKQWLVYWEECSFSFKFPLSENHVNREMWRKQTFYGKGLTDSFLGYREDFRIWTKLIAAIAYPLDS